MDKVKLAVVGCGAVAERVHLPAIALSDNAQAVVVVDKSIKRARELADAFGVAAVEEDYLSIVGKVDAAIVGVPHQLHARIACDLLRNRVPVLVEKPMALTTRECEEMIQAAEVNQTVLAVGLLRRFSESLQFVKHAIDAGLLGRITGFDLREGGVYSWPVASDSMFRKEAGGVLADAGAHALDLILWWLGDYDGVEYYDDAMGGVEADCLINLRLKNGAEGVVELSRTRTLRNSCILRGERGTLEVGTKSHSLIHLKIEGKEIVLTGEATRPGSAGARALIDLFRPQLKDFLDSVTTPRPPSVPGTEGKRGVGLIEACYGARQTLRHPWVFSQGSIQPR